MDRCAWCGNPATTGFGEYYRIDSEYSDRHELLMWCSRVCFDMAHSKVEALGRFGKYHKRHGDLSECIGEYYGREFPLSRLPR